MIQEIRLTVNNELQTLHTDEDRPLLDLLREDLGLTGTKFGCGEGECGACTVWADGAPIRSCITAASEVNGADIRTIEGLAADGVLHPVQQAFIDQQAMQCGYCVPGHIMTAAALVRDKPQATREEIIVVMSQHICRCCNYENILAAVEQAVRAQ